MKKIILTIVIASSTLSAHAMFMPAVSPMILLKLNKKHGPLSRKWLNELFKEEGSITGTEKVQRNFNHFYAVIKNHKTKLNYKSEHRSEIKNQKLKAFLGYVIATIAGYSVLNRPTRSRNSIFLHSIALGCLFTLFKSVHSLASWISFDLKLQQNLNRDSHILQELEEYKTSLEQ